MSTEYSYDQFLIGSQWAKPMGTERVEVLSPHSETIVGSLPRATPGDIDAAVAAARQAFDQGPWPRMSPADRIAVIERFSGLFAARLDDLARVISVEMGSPISFSNLAQAPAPWMQIEAFLNISREFPWE
ncbi:MAG TPA: aldehyde dehydrogenase family protein, partial [Marmoricola sp.]|nr:aldehyde dehydrogenase family protein [Marmoricola sp.]